ncbi:hypothetical protein FGB62_104g048 [Gracilaria domingensis]|nr:hypothetical protein FGB62_104g048 [Gracilaria domingensis]
MLAAVPLPPASVCARRHLPRRSRSRSRSPRDATPRHAPPRLRHHEADAVAAPAARHAGQARAVPARLAVRGGGAPRAVHQPPRAARRAAPLRARVGAAAGQGVAARARPAPPRAAAGRAVGVDGAHAVPQEVRAGLAEDVGGVPPARAAGAHD